MSPPPPAPRRRRRPWVWFAAAAGTALALVLTLLGVAGIAYVRAAVNTVDAVDFRTPLHIPPLAPSTLDDQGRRIFDLRLQRGDTDLGLGRPTGTWGANGSYLGPTLRAERGERVLIRVRNDVGETTTMHWHGMHLPARMDGGPHQPIAPGTTWSPTWRIDQPAATLWYHPHPHGQTALHVRRGLLGMFLLDDPQARALALPQRYGVDDVPVIVQDASFGDDAQLDEGTSLFSPTGALGSTVLVNGTIGPYLDVATQRVRLRLLNASAARVYQFALDEGRPFQVVGSDGGLLPAPVTTTRLRLSPGERAGVVVELAPGQRSVLRSEPGELGRDVFTQRFGGGDDALDVLQLRAADRLEASPVVPARLAPAPHLERTPGTPERTFRLDGVTINGQGMELGRVDEVVTVGTTEQWVVQNTDGTPHSFHVHGTQFQVVDVDGAPPPPELAGWKDTLFVAPGSSARLLVRFSDDTDPQTPYMIHCHVLRHEDQGMMLQFVVVRPGESAAVAVATPAATNDH